MRRRRAADGAGAEQAGSPVPGVRSPERGTAIVEFIGLSVVMLLPITYALVAALDLQRTSYGVSAAARAYGRAYQVTGPDTAAAAATAALGDQKLRYHPDAFAVSCVGDGGACSGPGGAVRVTVTYRAALPLVPGWASDDLSIRVRGVHVATYGQYRDGG